MQPLSARCMRTLLLQDGEPLLPVVLGRRIGMSRAQRCASGVIFMMRGIFNSGGAAMQGVRDWYPALFSPAKYTVQLFMWQHALWGWHTTSWVALMCLVPLDDASTSSSSALAAG